MDPTRTLCARNSTAPESDVKLADLPDLSLPTVQRMEASDGVIRGNVDSLMKLMAALDAAGVELIAENATGPGGGRGVRLKA